MSATKSLVGLSLGLAATVTIAVVISGGAMREPVSRVRPSTAAPATEPAAAYMGHRLRPSVTIGEPTEAANQGRWRYQ
jgi:hypothetical protein